MAVQPFDQDPISPVRVEELSQTGPQTFPTRTVARFDRLCHRPVGAGAKDRHGGGCWTREPARLRVTQPERRRRTMQGRPNTYGEGNAE